MPLDERAFFNDRPETRQARYQCPKCRRTGDYSVRWIRRTKKDRLPGGASEEDRAKFAKLRDYLLRVEDEVTCKTCGKKFEIPSQQSLLFVDQLAGLPNEEELEREGVPSSYREYIELLTEVFAECARKLEPGGRIAVNVANLGRTTITRAHLPGVRGQRLAHQT